MKKLFLILMFSSILIACKKEESVDSICCFSFDTEVYMRVNDSKGVDLLNPNNPNAFLKENIRLNYANSDAERDFKILKPPSSDLAYTLLFHPYRNEKENSITYIKWNVIDTDTIRTSYKYEKNYVKISKLWYNDILVWSENTGTNSFRSFVIIK
jgi:hypothetical protein